MNSRHQQFYKSRGNFRRRFQEDAYGFDKHPNTFAPLANQNSYRPFRGRFQSRGNQNRRFQKDRGGAKPAVQSTPPGQQPSTPPWSKVTLIDGKRYDRGFLFKELANYVEGRLKPVLYKQLENGDVQFLIEDNDVAQAIRSASRRIIAPNGQKIVINVNKCPAPVVPLQSSDVSLLKTLLDQRYDAINHSMNLTALSDDPSIQQHGVYLALSRNNVMLTVVNLIGDACSHLQSINLSKNRLRFLDFFANLAVLCPDVKKLWLSQNMIDNILELEKLSGWKDSLIELELDGNPLCNRFRVPSTYITAIRRIFPKLQRLDGTDLPPSFKTGIEEELSTVSTVHMPPIKGNFFVNDNYKGICSGFIQEYFTIFDNTDKQKREQLFQAYDDEAVFTMTAHNLTEESNRIRSSCWTEFIRDSHNIKNVTVWERYRSKLIHKGRLSILSFFCKDFPSVQHDASSFVVDVSFATDTLLCLNVSGIYRLAANPTGSGSTRFFTRVFLLIPKNNGLAIVNEQLFSTTMTSDQQDHYRRNYASLIEGDKISVTGSGSTSTESSVSTTIDQSLVTTLDAITDVSQKRQMMIQLFSQKSNMKDEWSKKCLEDCDWDFERAAFSFTELNKTGAIPREAFR